MSGYIKKVEDIVKALWKDEDTKEIEEYISDQLIIETPIEAYVVLKGTPTEKLKTIARYWREAFPGLRSHWTLVKEDDKGNVIVSWESQARHSGRDFMGISAKDVKVNYTGLTTYTFEKDKLVRYKAEVSLDEIQEKIK